MFRRAWKPIFGATAVVLPTSYLYLRYTASDRSNAFSIDVKEKGPDAKVRMIKRSFPLIPKPAIEQRINEFATSTSLAPSQGVVWKHSTAHLSSNDPIEDAHAEAVVTTQPTSSDPARSILFYSVMDGHAGFHTSRLLSRVLIPAVVLELSLFARDGGGVSAKMSSLLDVLKSPFSPRSPSHVDAPQGGHIERVSQAIQRAFENVDFEIVNGPLRVLAANVDKLDKENIPDLSQHPMGEASMLPALSGMS